MVTDTPPDQRTPNSLSICSFSLIPSAILTKSPARGVPKEECPDENSDFEKTVPAGATTDPRGGQLPRSGVPVGRRGAPVRREGRRGHRHGRGREYLPRP